MTLSAAAYHLRLLEAAEQAFAVGDERTLESVMAGVDPVEVRELAVELEQAALAEEVRPSHSRGGEVGIGSGTSSASAAHENGGEPTESQTAGAPPHLATSEISVYESPFAPVTHTGFSGATP